MTRDAFGDGGGVVEGYSDFDLLEDKIRLKELLRRVTLEIRTTAEELAAKGDPAEISALTHEASGALSNGFSTLDELVLCGAVARLISYFLNSRSFDLLGTSNPDLVFALRKIYDNLEIPEQDEYIGLNQLTYLWRALMKEGGLSSGPEPAPLDAPGDSMVLELVQENMLKFGSESLRKKCLALEVTDAGTPSLDLTQAIPDIMGAWIRKWARFPEDRGGEAAQYSLPEIQLQLQALSKLLVKTMKKRKEDGNDSFPFQDSKQAEGSISMTQGLDTERRSTLLTARSSTFTQGDPMSARWKQVSARNTGNRQTLSSRRDTSTGLFPPESTSERCEMESNLQDLVCDTSSRALDVAFEEFKGERISQEIFRSSKEKEELEIRYRSLEEDIQAELKKKKFLEEIATRIRRDESDTREHELRIIQYSLRPLATKAAVRIIERHSVRFLRALRMYRHQRATFIQTSWKRYNCADRVRTQK